ncbi:MAG: hypothetical protein EBS83_14330 [Planctomycetia bacterium]|nr:hypothetical protein [Planctomycetia bacterium]
MEAGPWRSGEIDRMEVGLARLTQLLKPRRRQHRRDAADHRDQAHQQTASENPAELGHHRDLPLAARKE